MFSCEILQILKNTYFEEHLRTTLSVLPRIYKFINSSSDFRGDIVFCIITSSIVKNTTAFKHLNSDPLTININLFKQLNINQMFDKIQMILMMKTSISNNRISRLNNKNLEQVTWPWWEYKTANKLLTTIKATND